MKRNWMIALGILLALAIAGGSFVGGMALGKKQAQAQTSQFGPGQGFVRRFEGTPGAEQAGSGRSPGLIGTIQTVGEGFLTITDQSGKQTQINVTDTTLIQKQVSETQSLTLAELKLGDTVMVSGSQGSDGSYTARSVQVVTGGSFMIGGPQGEFSGGTPTPVPQGSANP